MLSSKRVDVTSLRTDIDYLDNYATLSDKDRHGGVIIEFLVGVGSAFVEEATAACDDRADEIENQRAVDDFLARAAAFLGADDVNADVLNQAAAYMEETSKAHSRKKVKKDHQSFTPSQKAVVEAERQKVSAHVSKGVAKELVQRVERVFAICAEAVDNDGYVKSVEGLVGAVSLDNLETVLCPVDIVDHAFCKVAVKPALGEHLLDLMKRHKATSATLLGVLSYALCRTKALQTFATRPKEVAMSSVDAIRPWLEKISVSVTVLENWQPRWLEAFMQESTKQIDDAAAKFKIVVGECAAGKFTGLPKEVVDACVAPLPSKSSAKKVVAIFLQLVQEYTHLLKQASDATPKKLQVVQRLSSQVLADVAKSVGEGSVAHELEKRFELDSPALKDFVESVRAKADEMQNACVTGALGKLDALTTNSEKKLGSVCKTMTTEKDFRTHMQQQGNALAKFQKDLKAGIEAVRAQAGIPKTDPGSKADTPSGQAAGVEDTPVGQATPDLSHLGAELRTRVEEALAKAGAAEATCMQYTCMYVAFTLFRNTATSRDNVIGAKNKELLRGVLDKLEGLSGIESIFFEEMTAMQKLVPKKNDSASLVGETASTRVAAQASALVAAKEFAPVDSEAHSERQAESIAGQEAPLM